MDARQMAANLHFDKKGAVSPGLHRATFWDGKESDKLLAARKADVPKEEWAQFIEFLAHTPANVLERAEGWNRGKIPRSLDEVRSPVDEFVWRLQLFVKCIDKSQVPTVE